MISLHRALIDFSRARVLEGAREELTDEVRDRADAALALLERGLGGYGVHS